MMNKPITLCDKCDICMSCLLDYDGIPCRKNRTVEPTNADRIRAMTDEELAKLIAYEGCPLDGRSCWHTPLNYDNCHSCWLDWLKQEVKE